MYTFLVHDVRLYISRTNEMYFFNNEYPRKKMKTDVLENSKIFMSCNPGDMCEWRRILPVNGGQLYGDHSSWGGPGLR